GAFGRPAPRRLGAEDRLALRGRLEPRSPGRAEWAEDRPQPGAPAAASSGAGTVPKGQPVTGTDRGLLRWTLSFMRPHRHRAALLVVLLAIEIALGALQPWPLKIVIDYVLNQHPLPASVAGPLEALTGDNRIALLVLFVVAGVVVQLVNQIVTAYAVQVQITTGQRMVYTLRYRLLEHLEGLGLDHHVKTNTGDSVYRVDVDSYSIENLAMSGVLPLVTSSVTLLVMFIILLQMNVTVALL